MRRSKIGWADYSGSFLNSVLRGTNVGDCEVSRGCTHCYAREVLLRFQKKELDGGGHHVPASTTTWSYEKLLKFRRWNTGKEILAVLQDRAEPFRRGKAKPIVFLNDMGDLFHADVPDQFIFDTIVAIIDKPELDCVVLTKRAKRMNELVRAFYGSDDSVTIPNLWLGVSAESQTQWNHRVPALAATPAAVRLVSVEPMLGPIGIQRGLSQLHWVICGGESGPERREFDHAWARDVYQQCKDAGVPFFFKQGSSLRPGYDDDLPGIGKVKEFPR